MGAPQNGSSAARESEPEVVRSRPGAPRREHPLADSERVFRAVGATLGFAVRRIPDGETGKRSRWNSWTAPTYERTRGLELVAPHQLVHVPVPIDRDDDAYFEQLEALELDPRSELYLGLIHYDDGIEGARRRIATARRHSPPFGVATECGFARRPPETIEPLLAQHAQVASVDD